MADKQSHIHLQYFLSALPLLNVHAPTVPFKSLSWNFWTEFKVFALMGISRRLTGCHENLPHASPSFVFIFIFAKIKFEIIFLKLHCNSMVVFVFS